MEDQDLENLDMIDQILATDAKQTILQEMGLQNLNNYLILDERQEEAKRIAANATPRKFSEMVDKLSEAFTGGVYNAAVLFDRTLETLNFISTGIQDLDNLLNGGIYNNKITELTGVAGSGKTRFCVKLMLYILAKTSDRVLYIDSGSSFSIERIEYYCTKFGMTKNSSQMDILHARIRHMIAFRPKDLILTLVSLIESLSKGKSKITLVIIDSFSSIMNINTDLTEYEEHLTEVYRLLKILNTTYSVGVLVTTIAKLPNIKSQKPRSLLSTPWNFMPQTSILIECTSNDANRADTQRASYKMTLLSHECSDDFPSTVVQLGMHPTSKRADR